MRATHLVVAFIAAAAIALAACASTAPGSEAAEGNFVVPIEVDNSLGGLIGSTVYIIRANGSGRRLLGPVESGQKRTFQYDGSIGQYRLIARKGATDSVTSEQFRLEPGMAVRWSLGMNQLLTGTAR